jgi:hypothetical protein
MLRWLSLTLLCVLALTFAGCSGGNSEIPAKTDAGGPKMTPKETMHKAMQGMPPEIQKKIMSRNKL